MEGDVRVVGEGMDDENGWWGRGWMMRMGGGGAPHKPSMHRFIA